MSPAPTSPKRWALSGRIVTMATKGDVIENGTIFIEDQGIAAVLPKGQPAPAGFEAINAIDTGGTIYPGLIELHNHLSYNILPLWQVPQLYQNRDQWQNAASYKTSVTGPMSAIALADDGSLLPALVRYVEAKCLIGGTTTSQGITLSNWSARPRSAARPTFPGRTRKFPTWMPRIGRSSTMSSNPRRASYSISARASTPRRTVTSSL